MSADKQPTLENLVKLYAACKDSAGSDTFGGNFAALQAAREAKHTWVGSEENSFRFVLDHYINGE